MGSWFVGASPARAGDYSTGRQEPKPAGDVLARGAVYRLPSPTPNHVFRYRARECEAGKNAQDAATKKGNDIIEYLKKEGVEEKDIKTTDYSVSPQYE